MVQQRPHPDGLIWSHLVSFGLTTSAEMRPSGSYSNRNTYLPNTAISSNFHDPTTLLMVLKQPWPVRHSAFITFIAFTAFSPEQHTYSPKQVILPGFHHTATFSVSAGLQTRGLFGTALSSLSEHSLVTVQTRSEAILVSLQPPS